MYNGTTASPAPGKARSGSICYDFVKGVCSRGAECRYSHDLSLIARMARGSGEEADQGQPADVCFDYLRCGVGLKLCAFCMGFVGGCCVRVEGLCIVGVLHAGVLRAAVVLVLG